MSGFIVETDVLNVFGHMAYDELLASSLPKDKNQVFLRFYNWGENAAKAMTFGYAQFFSDIQKESSFKTCKDVTRRPTGGGVVYHNCDLTFSLVFRSEIKRVQELYDNIHGAINKHLAVEEKGLSVSKEESATALYAPSVDGGANACFSNPVKSDILNSEGNKILGGAIRRWDNIVLYQGSLQTATARANKNYIHALKNAVADYWNVNLKQFSHGSVFIKKAQEEAVSKYTAEEWIRKF
ncbi:Biotin/lipoate A/B protein ligase [Elusimicrobium minutum Pei191]|uniref:Biotin/lipoate A/B protein ligase n=1 Tax=Elusimicrobium minutum (strain Pei191) TaxID=445932 RepID=B2KEF0_ELUMP|nr:biotin/lipoate A/B protein ligase [Elusimicrobium minutum]ACC98896.1 Biotin/lipoate A/B protein ligase [Elusimicrobium minutum Pei191]